MKEIRNIGIFAHVDAGKTTLTENILYHTGGIRKKGRVDYGSAHTDNLEVERSRGISVKSANAMIRYKNTEINIIDTPGHVDFSAEVERALMVLDAAILVISCIEGVQSQTEVIWKALKSKKIPTIIFINKIDRIGANINKVVDEVQNLINQKGLLVNEVTNEGCKDVRVKINNKRLLETACLLNEHLFNLYVENKSISMDDVHDVVHQKTKHFECIPILFGAALNGIGTQNVLDAVVNYLPNPVIHKDLLGLIYKVNHEAIGGKTVHIRLYGGFIKVRDTIYNNTKNQYEKVTKIFKVEGTKLIQKEYLKGGEIGIITGLKYATIGDVIGKKYRKNHLFHMVKPTLTVRVYPKQDKDLKSLVECFNYLDEEDPYLNVNWQEKEKELHVQLMGIIQMEILTKIIKDRFNIDVIFEKPTVIYKETPTKIGKGFIDLKTPFFGALEMQVEPLKRNSGVIYQSAYTTDFIFPRFQNEVKEVVPTVLKEGVYGWEVTDVKVMITGGRSIKLSTSPGDFKKITPMPVMDALKAAEMTLLEPIHTFECMFHVKDSGIIFNDLYQMRAKIIEQKIKDDTYYVSGTIPLSTSMDYAVKIVALSKGKSEFKTKFKTYEPCSINLGKIKKRTTVDPSDHKRYLLSVLPKNIRDDSNSQ